MSRQQATNRELGVDTARANLLTNGGGEIWQRGAGSFTAQGAVTADGWMIWVGAGTFQVDREGVAKLGESQYSIRVIVGAGGSGALYNFPGKELVNQLRGVTVTFSAWVLTSVANAVCLRAWHSPNVGASGAFHTGSGAWERLTVTQLVATNSTDFHAEVVFSAAGTYYIDNATLVVGSVSGNYVPLHPADDLARCLRYYERMGFTSAAYPMILLAGTGATTVYGSFPFMARKAVQPTVTVTSGWQLNNFTAPTMHSANQDGFLMQGSTVGAGLGYAHATTSSGVIIEANP